MPLKASKIAVWYFAMNPLLEQWHNQKEKKSKENFRFLTQLKSKNIDGLETKVEEIHDDVFSEINCLDCGNCCKSYTINLTQADCERISSFLGKDILLELDCIETPSEEILIQTIPCPFLGADNACSIYEVRPESCRDYPHFKGKSIVSRRYVHSENTVVCPATFHILERIKDAIGE